MRYTIYRGNNPVVQNIRPEGTVTERIMGEETVNISFSLTSKIEFHIGDKITVFGKDYFLAADPVTNKKNSREFQYQLIFLSVKYSLRDVQLFFYDDENDLTIPEFSIMGTADKCLDVILANANRDGKSWKKGIVDETEVKNVSFSDINCLEAVAKVAEEFKLEYWIDSDKSIHFTERKPVSGYTFEYGKAKGLKDITRSVLEGGSIVTRLYVKGSDKNLPKNYRKGQKHLRIDVPYLEANIDKYGKKEHTETFADIYPKRLGTVTAVDENDPNRFVDADLDFDLNEYNEYGSTILMNGIAAKVIFQTGQLAGYRLELIAAGGFHSATKTFYLNPNKDEKDLQIPSALLRPAVGDKYILEDIMMPNAYVLLAESELKTKAIKYLEQNSTERFQYTLISDIIYFKNQNISVQLGATARFIDSDFDLDDDIRVTAIQKNIQNPYDVKFDLSEVTLTSSIVQSYYDQQEQQNTLINQVKYNAELARRNYLFGREFHDKVFDGEGYFDAENIKPLSIETKMLSLGSRLQQFALPGVNFQIQNNTALSNTAGKLSHQTIDENKVREWNIAANTVMGITSAFNYIYIKAQKAGNNANFVVTEAQIKVEQDPDFYHFEVGYLSSVIDGYRKIKTTYGFAQLNPAELSIGRISDPSGNNYIDLLQDRIAVKAKVEFTSDSPAIEQINNSIVIGGRNLALESKEFIDSQSYWVRDVDLAESFEVGKEYTVTIWTKVKNQNANSFFRLGHPDGSHLVNVLKVYENKYTATFAVAKATRKVILFREPNDESWYQFEKIKIEIGNKPTDWTPSPEDLRQELDQVENTINIANNMLADIASDNKLTPSEKQLLKKEYDIILSEKPQLQAQANVYGVSTINYVNSYNNLVVYTNPLLVNLNSTTDVVGAVLRSTYANYYTAKINLLKGITDKINNDIIVVNQAVQNAQTTANTAQNLINDIANDNKLTPSEKQSLVLEFNRIKTEYNQNNSSATTLGLSVTGYQTGYNNLNSYITPLLANLTTTSDIVGARFRTNFQNYYNANVAIVTAIETKKIENIQIGGRNLFLNSKKWNIGNWWSFDGGTQVPQGDAGIRLTKQAITIIDNKTTSGTTSEPMVVGEVYTVSFDYLGSTSFEVSVGTKVYKIERPNSSEKGRFFITFTYASDFNGYLYITNQLEGSSVAVKNLKLEKGNKATDYTPAPEDVQSQIDTNTNNTQIALAQAQNAIDTANRTANITSFLNTTVDKNVVATGTLLVGDIVGANGGMTGVIDQGLNSVSMWFGSTYQNRYDAPLRFTQNGGIYTRNIEIESILPGSQNAGIALKHGMITIRNGLGNKLFEFGALSNNEAAFNIFNKDGLMVASIGDRGIVFNGYLPESYEETEFWRFSNQNMTIDQMCEEARSRSRTLYQVSTNAFTHNISSPNTMSYLYFAGYNFESANNEVYNYKYFMGKNKLGNMLADGWYALSRKITISKTNQVNFAVEIYRIENGNVVEMDGKHFSEPWSWFYII